MVFLAENEEELQIEYTQMKEFWFFIDRIKQMAPEYDYVCARERRCFNIVARFLPGVDMISTRALALKYKEIAEYYRQHKRFPKILILDDLMIHGRGMAKFLQQLEDMLVIKLLDMGLLQLNDNYRYTVYRNLADAVTIFVYAKTAGVIFLEDGYLNRIRTVKVLYADEMRDLSLQISHRMKQWDIANTSYVYSVRSELLTECLREQSNGRIGSSNWVRKTWKYGGEDMILYTRLCGKKAVSRVDTIRFFPGRCSAEESWREELPLLTSFSFFGDLRKSALHRIFKEAADILESAGLCNLADILKVDTNEQINYILMQIQIQLIGFILSVAMLLDFCLEVVPQGKIDDITMRGDIWKISSNFGRRNEIRPEMMQLRKKSLRTKLKEAILRVIDEEAEELIQVNPMVALEQLDNNNITASIVNNEVRRAIYHIGMKSERKAYEQSMRPYRFVPEEYQEHCGSDGVISLRELAQKKQFSADSGSIYSYLAAFVAMMDSCAVSMRTKAIRCPNEEIRVCTLAKAGEMSAFYLPEKVAMFVPVFAVLEMNTFGSTEARKRNLKYYLKQLVAEYFSQDCMSLKELLDTENQIDLVKLVKNEAMKALDLQEKGETLVLSNNFLREIEMFYDAGHSFCGWNFQNLNVKRKMSDDDSYQRAYQAIKTLRNHLINKIEEMGAFILPPED